MDNITLARIIGLAVVIVIFIGTVLLMPRIFGVNPPVRPAQAPPVPEPATPPASAPTSTPALDARPTVAAAAAQPLAKR